MQGQSSWGMKFNYRFLWAIIIAQRGLIINSITKDAAVKEI